MFLKRLILGRPLPNREYGERKIGAFEGVPTMGLDGLGSSAYGPEAALTVLIPLGALSLAYIGPITAVIVALLAILYVSYRQTIRAYPSNGGAYTVSKENLGRNASLLAAAALMIDYVLNVAVGISAGVGALVSAMPALYPYTLWLCLGILTLITLVNLRGTLDAGRLFALPTYTFVISFILLLGLGLYRVVISGGEPRPVVPPPALAPTTAAASLWLLMHAFASGCTAMTGVEAVSNGVSAFREPKVKYAHRTLTAIVVILGLLLAGIAYLASSYGIGAMDQTQKGYQSVLSQLAQSVVGRGIFYSVAIGSLLCVLALSANTSFTDFPRLCRTIAEDDFLPRPFAVVGRRLVFSVGILYLAVTAGGLLIAFGGITERLIPLFAIGAFLTFTLSQAGMVVHWRRERRKNPSAKHEWRLAINGLGALVTGLALVVIITAKFTEGAWITLLVIPCVILLLRSFRRYYDGVNARIREDAPLDLSETAPPIVLVVTEEWSRLTDKALHFAIRLSPDVVAVHMVALSGPESEDKEKTLQQQWTRFVEEPARRAGLKPPRLLLLQAQYRRMHGPLLKLVRQIEAEHPERMVAILIPELVKRSWWQYLLHTHRARRLRSRLLQYGGAQVVVINVPWYLEEPRLEDALVESEVSSGPA
ncbi:APC family permease [Microvirga sp. TS319]|uniref:APC family permease n=1 Tax=Microvirga sp. TS319 TaxID=3241165 RepID=UPI00351A17AE